MNLDSLFGNRELKAVLKGFASRDAFPNSFMISGPEGSGKRLAASLFAMAIACKGHDRPCGVCEACRKISESISPDVIVIEREGDKKTLGVDAVRRIKDEAYVIPNDLDKKIFIINEAERLTSQAQNALLKLFEEGPSNVYFILLTSSPSKLLPTVRSRAPEIKTEVFTEKRLSELLAESSKKASDLLKKDETEFKRIVAAAKGSYGKALDIAEGRNKKSVKTIKKAEELIARLSESDKASLILGLIAESSDRENYVAVLRLMQSALRDMALVKRGGGAELCFFADRERAEELSLKFSLKNLILLSSKLEVLANDAETSNINLRTAAIVAAGRLI